MVIMSTMIKDEIFNIFNFRFHLVLKMCGRQRCDMIISTWHLPFEYVRGMHAHGEL